MEGGISTGLKNISQPNTSRDRGDDSSSSEKLQERLNTLRGGLEVSQGSVSDPASKSDSSMSYSKLDNSEPDEEFMPGKSINILESKDNLFTLNLNGVIIPSVITY